MSITESTFQLLGVWLPFIFLLAIWIAVAYYCRRKAKMAKNSVPENIFGPSDCITIARRVDATNFLRKFAVIIDDCVVGYVSAGEVIHFPITPGIHTVVVKVDWCRSKPISVEKLLDSNVALWCGSRYNDWRCIVMAFVRPSEYVFVVPYI